MRLTSANQAIIPLSMRSVFSRKPIASAKRRTARGLTIAVARPAPHSMAKASRSYPPVALSATKPTWCSLQNAINSVIPAPLLVKRRIAPSRPSRTSSAAEQTSTPQIRSVTVTCLVHAIDNRATVRSCVTLQQAVPRLTSGCCRRGNGRRTPRTGSGGHLTPCSAAPITLRRRLLDTRGNTGGAEGGSAEGPSPAARLIGTPRKRTISAREVSHGRSNELGWSGAGRGGASARVWRGGARARRQDVTPAQERGGAAAVARGRPGDRLARAGCHSRDADRLARCLP